MEKESAKDRGKRGEEKAVEFLKAIGYSIVERNYRNRLGEIDIIARDGQTIVFIEVRKRDTDTFGAPADSIDIRKQKRIGRVALSYITEKRLLNVPARFDVVSIHRETIELIKDAFEYT